MTSRRTALRHVFAGGWATDLSPRALVSPDASGLVQIPYLLTAENIVYELDGGPRKAPGTSKVNGTALESGARIRGCYDAWFHGTSGTPAQHRILQIADKILADDGTGTFSTTLFSSLSSTSVATFAMIEDLLVIGLDSGEAPKSWDGSTAQDLSGSPPNCSIWVLHANRLWGAGDWTRPSALYYSPLLDPENSSGEGWGRINVDPNDGDRITGMISFKGELIVGKGPYKGSIHRVAGTAPTGDDAYRRTRWIEKIGFANQNAIFTLKDDVGFMSFDGQVHSLKAVAAYGDFNEVALGRQIQKFLRRINFARIRQVQAASGCDCGYVLFTAPIDGSNTNNAIFGMDYRFASESQAPRWFYWPDFDGYVESVMPGIDPGAANQRIYFAGGGDGYLRKLLQEARSFDDGDAAIAMRVETPFFDYGLPFHTKSAGEGYLQLAPKNDGDIDLNVKCDSHDAVTFPISQAAGDPLGLVDGDNFTLGVSALAEAQVIERFFEIDSVGDFRQIQYQISNSVIGEDVEIHGLGITLEQGSISTENSL